MELLCKIEKIGGQSGTKIVIRSLIKIYYSRYQPDREWKKLSDDLWVLPVFSEKTDTLRCLTDSLLDRIMKYKLEQEEKQINNEIRIYWLEYKKGYVLYIEPFVNSDFVVHSVQLKHSWIKGLTTEEMLKNEKLL